MIAPPQTLPRVGQLALGTHVRWTHRAAVARWLRTGSYHDKRDGIWLLVEGVPKRSGWRPRMSAIPPGESPDVLAFTQDLDPFYERPPRDGTNKTVIVWPEDGDGIMFGLVRRGIGESVGASGSTSMYSDDYEPGFFAARAFVALYAVKVELTGVDYLLVPTWAVTVA